MAFASYLVASTIMHCFHDHHACDSSACKTDAAQAAGECHGCHHEHHVALCEAEQEKTCTGDSCTGECFRTATELGSLHTDCAVCRFLAKSSTESIAADPPAIGKAKPCYVAPEPGLNDSVPTPAWHSRAPPLFSII